ncbi:hypothetical protein BJV78DRAFT_1207792 [Lactifluus subvellereus]|nr:hypothetical protein BJV78DRAFT_1207792 [Lactifluus subvellereus]
MTTYDATTRWPGLDKVNENPNPNPNTTLREMSISGPTRNQNNGEPSMLSCPASRCPLPAWGRTFSSAEALLDHARQARALHPLCMTCFRVFKDTAALDQHVEAKHVVLCQPCNRKYKSQSALDQHWRASTAHPNCPICEAGAPDTSALAQHIANAHPKVRCCGTLLDEIELDAHYLTSRSHPVCDKCNVGFATEVEFSEHNSELHSELRCWICEVHFPSEDALRAHTRDLSSHSRCEFCSAQFKDTSALVEHFTEMHLQRDDVQDPSRNSVVESSPSPPMNQPYISSSRPTSSVIGSGRAIVSRPEPPSRASTSLSTSVSDIGSDLYRSPPSMGTFSPSLPSLSSSSSNLSHPQHFNGLPASARSPQPGTSPSQLPDATLPVYASAMAVIGPHPGLARAHPAAAFSSSPALSSSPSPSPPPLPVTARVMGPVGPVTPARKSTHAPSQTQSQSQSQSRQAQQPQPPSSARSKTSVAETPSGDLANFHLLKGSPLQSVVDFDTPTPSPRTPSAPSVSPADAQAYALGSNGGGSYLPLAADRRFLPGSSVSPSVGRAQRAMATPVTVKSSFYCRICGLDPCHEITATGCGHMFCNPCIVEEVRENARCPVCYAAVLLFALLKLDVS